MSEYEDDEESYEVDFGEVLSERYSPFTWCKSQLVIIIVSICEYLKEEMSEKQLICAETVLFHSLFMYLSLREKAGYGWLEKFWRFRSSAENLNRLMEKARELVETLAKDPSLSLQVIERYG